MADEQSRLRQMRAATRLRALQREKAELQRGKALQRLLGAQQVLAAERELYEHDQEASRRHAGVGALLDPALHEQRIYAQIGRQHSYDASLQNVVEARLQHQDSVQALLASTLREDVVLEALKHARVAIAQLYQEQEAVDVFDAQQAGGGEHGR